ncbi:MAG: hypothetical protein ABI599_03010 [Flavobacteriales bacterium]
MWRIAAILCLLPFVVSAQHCGHDIASLIAVRSHAAGDNAVIDGLRITLLVSNNVPMVLNSGTLHPFWRNVEQVAPVKRALEAKGYRVLVLQDLK